MRGRTHLGFTVITLLILCAALQVAPARSMTIIPALPDGELLKVTISCDAPYRAPDSTQEALPHRTLDSAQESLPLLARLVALPVGTTSVKLVGGTATGTAGVYDLSPDQVLLSSVMIMRGQPVVVVSLNAGTFSDDLRAGLEHIEIALAPTHDASTDPFVHDGSGTDMAHPMCFTEGAGGLETNRGVYMIIAADEFVEALSDFVTWKTQAGFDVRLFAVSEIESPTTREGLLAFVQDAYDTWETPPLYLLLVGDVGDVPAWDIGANVSDHPYACLDGDDFIADLYVGRFSASSAAEVDVQVAKTVGYESHPDTTAGGGEWFSRALLVAGDLGSSTPKPTSRWIGQELLNIGYTQIDSCFGPPFWDEGKIIIPLMVNSGVGIVNYRGWAIGDAGWQPPTFTVDEIRTLENGWMLPVVFSIVCHTGNFGNPEQDCFGEVWLKVGTPEEPKGAIGFIGTGEHWSHSRWNDRLGIGIFESFCHEGERRLGAVLAATKVSLLEHFPTEIDMYDDRGMIVEESVGYYAHIYNLLGDPSLQIWSAKPRPLVIQHPAAILNGQNFVQVLVLETDGSTPIANARLAFVQDDQIIGFAVTGEDGLARAGIAVESANIITITVTGENLYPWQGEIEVTTVDQYLACTSAEVAGGGQLIPGTAAQINLTVRNTGGEDLAGVTATIEPPANVTLVAGTPSFGDVAAGDEAHSLGDVQILPDPGIENGERLRFLLCAAESGFDISTTQFWLTAEAPDFRCIALSDGKDDLFDPGEEIDLILTLSNEGIPAGDIQATLRVLAPDMATITDSTAHFSEIPAGSNAANPTDDPFTIQIHDDIAIGTVIPMELIAVSTDGPQTVVHFNLIVGAVDFSSPIGPDQYGYYCLDSADIEYRGQVPIYQWIECSPTFGGHGVLLDRIIDNYISQVVELPFTFKYYGRDYDSIRVSDNGWISFDTAYWYDIRNWNMPDIWGGACQVAPFWDNLDPDIEGSDGVYTLYDEDQHYFVIEWSRLMNWEETTDDYQTFEVLLRDPAFCDTDDGEIIFQYKQIVNDDWVKMYSTVGIEDHTEEDGLLYTYANIYTPGAAPLSPGLAIKFTTARPTFQAIELTRFEALWSASGAGNPGPSDAGAHGMGLPGVELPGTELPGMELPGILLHWEWTDPRPLAYFEVFRSPAREDGEGSSEPRRIHEGTLAPASGSLFDTRVNAGESYCYQMIGVDLFGKQRVIGETFCACASESGPSLRMPDGNLVCGTARILYSAGRGEVRALAIYTVEGRRIRDLLSGQTSHANSGEILWDGRDQSGSRVPGGVYWMRLSTSEADQITRLVVIR